MKRNLFLILFIVFSIINICGCDIQQSSNHNSISNQSTTETYYIDYSNFVSHGINFSMNCSETMMQNYDVTIILSVKNTQLNDKSFAINNLKVVNENTSVSYNFSVGNLYGTAILQYNITNNLYITGRLPTSYSTEHYYMTFDTLDAKYIIKLYEKPDDLRENHTISFKLYSYPNYINAGELTIKDGRKGNGFIWEDPNHQYYCDTWYLDEARSNSFSWNTKITGDMVLYGLKLSIVQTTYDSGDIFVNQIKYVPTDGIIVLSFSANRVYLSNYALYNNNSVKEIYLPSNLKKIYNGNFMQMSSLTTIHFAGSETEWNNIEKTTSIPANISIVFNSTYRD